MLYDGSEFVARIRETQECWSFWLRLWMRRRRRLSGAIQENDGSLDWPGWCSIRPLDIRLDRYTGSRRINGECKIIVICFGLELSMRRRMTWSTRFDTQHGMRKRRRRKNCCLVVCERVGPADKNKLWTRRTNTHTHSSNWKWNFFGGFYRLLWTQREKRTLMDYSFSWTQTHTVVVVVGCSGTKWPNNIQLGIEVTWTVRHDTSKIWNSSNEFSHFPLHSSFFLFLEFNKMFIGPTYVLCNY